MDRLPPELLSSLLQQYAILDENLRNYKPSLKTNTKELLWQVSKASRSNSLEILRLYQSNWRNSREKIRVFVEEFKTSVVLASYCWIFMDDEKALGKEVSEMITKQKKVNDGEMVEIFGLFDRFLEEAQKCGLVVNVLVLMRLFEIHEIGYLFFDLFKADHPCLRSGIVNWITINKVLLKIKAIEGEVDRFIHQGWIVEEEETLKKFGKVREFIFNEEYFRSWNKDMKVPIQMDLEILSDSVHSIVAQSTWTLSDIDLDPQYLTPDQYNQHSFRNIIRRCFPDYSLSEIIGDGNCFYRAVVRFFWDHIPLQDEERVSLDLRRLLNPLKLKRKRDHEDGEAKESKKEKHSLTETESSTEVDTPNLLGSVPFNGHTNSSTAKEKLSTSDCHEESFDAFEEEGITDPSTMQKPGVWADHLQVLKLSRFLNREVWLYRYDDTGIQLDENGLLIPGKDYRIFKTTNTQKTSTQLSPITLYFIPETHYEVVKHKSENIPTETQVILTQLSILLQEEEMIFSKPLDMANLLVVAWISLQNEVSNLDELFVMLGIVDVATRVDLRAQLQQQNEILTSQIAQLLQITERLNKINFLRLLRKSGGKLHANILEEIINEKLSEETNNLGPLRLLLDQLEYYIKNLWTIEYRSYHYNKYPNDMVTCPTFIYNSQDTTVNPVIEPNPIPMELQIEPPISNGPNIGEKLLDNLQRISGDNSHILEKPSSIIDWQIKLKDASKYCVNWAEKINGKSLQNLLDYGNKRLKKIKFTNCHFSNECCDCLQAFAPKNQLKIVISNSTLNKAVANSSIKINKH